MKIDFYQSNRGYSEKLRDSDPRRHQSLPALCGKQSFYAKYERCLSAGCSAEDRILDVGCGAGQVVHALQKEGLSAYGIDVSETSIELAGGEAKHCQVYHGRAIPFPAATFRAVGAFNVLEHVEDAVAFLDEMDRVLCPGGRMVVSSPNFLRVLGWRDYHPHMRGLAQKWQNFKTILARQKLYAADEHAVVFEKMVPISRPDPRPDDDATVVTNPLDMARYFRARGYAKIEVSCVDRPVPRLVEWVLDASPLRYLILNSFVQAVKTK